MDLNSHDNFTEFYKANKENEERLAKVDKVLSQAKILDPAVGSGHFLMAVADVISDWRRKCINQINEYSLRKSTIINNLYGVEIMGGAVEICKLRLWLWLISSQKKDSKPEPLPNIDFNIRQGNSLIGFAKKEIKIGQRKLLITSNLEDSLKKYSSKIDKYKRETSETERKRKSLKALHDKMQKKLNNWYVKTLDLKVEEEINSSNQALKVLEKSGRKAYKLKLKFNSSVSDDLKESLSKLGFRTWKKSANLKLKYKDINSRIKETFNLISRKELSKA